MTKDLSCCPERGGLGSPGATEGMAGTTGLFLGLDVAAEGLGGLSL